MPERTKGLITMPIADSPASRLAPCTTIEDCGHILTYAMRRDNGTWVCVHRAHGIFNWMPIILDPIAHPAN